MNASFFEHIFPYDSTQESRSLKKSYKTTTNNSQYLERDEIEPRDSK